MCKRTNCITCQAVHDGMDCKQYQQYILNDDQDENSKKTREWIEVRGENRIMDEYLTS